MPTYVQYFLYIIQFYFLEGEETSESTGSLTANVSGSKTKSNVVPFYNIFFLAFPFFLGGGGGGWKCYKILTSTAMTNISDEHTHYKQSQGKMYLADNILLDFILFHK